MVNNYEDDLLEKCSYKKKSLGEKHVFTTPRSIEDISQFEVLLDVCEQAHEDEVIVLNIFCYGGCFSTTVAVYNALVRSKATVVTVNQSKALSGGSVLLLAGDAIAYDPYSTVMIHTSKYGKYIDSNPEQRESAIHHDKALSSFYRDVYKGYLTDDEIEDVLKGTPMYIYDAEQDDRLKSLMEYRETLVEEYENSLQPYSYKDLKKKSKDDLIKMIVGEEVVSG